MRKFLSCAALAAAALGGVSTSANAYVVMQLSDGTTAYNCSTLTGLTLANTACNAGFGSVVIGSNTLTFNGSVGNFQVINTAGVGNQPGGPTSVLNASTTQVTNSGSTTGNFFIALLGYDFTLPPGPVRTLLGSASETASRFTAGDQIVNLFATDPADAGGAPAASTVNCTLTIVLNSSCNSGSPVLWTDTAAFSTFSIRDVQTFTLASMSAVNSTSTVLVNDTPEPVSTSLVGAGLLALALSSRRRRALKA